MLETFIVLLQADTLAGAYWKSREFLFFGLGTLTSLILFLFAFCRPMMWLYVAGHELTHALFVLMDLTKQDSDKKDPPLGDFTPNY